MVHNEVVSRSRARGHRIREQHRGHTRATEVWGSEATQTYASPDNKAPSSANTSLLRDRCFVADTHDHRTSHNHAGTDPRDALTARSDVSTSTSQMAPRAVALV